MNGTEPYLSAARTLLRESGCTVRKWQKNTNGRAYTSSADWGIDVPEPRGPISYATFAHEIAHQMLHRTGNRARWVEELEAWLWALDTFERFSLPGIEQAQTDCAKCVAYSIEKGMRRLNRKPELRERLALRIVSTLPLWLLDTLSPREGRSTVTLAWSDYELALARERAHV